MIHATKLPFNKILEITKALKNFGFMAQKIEPNKFGMIINKTDIIIVASNRSWGRPPYIRKNEVHRTR